MEHYNVDQKIQEFIARIEAKNPNEPEFLVSASSKRSSSYCYSFYCNQKRIQRYETFGENG